jgi:hypothetical protein
MRQFDQRESRQEPALQTAAHLAAGDPVLLRQAYDGGGGRPLTRSTQEFLESRFGRNFRKVRVHTGAGAVAATRALKARAFTVGRDIFFAPGQYAPETPDGLYLLAHELVHVVQQGFRQTDGGAYQVGPSEDPLEAEADFVAAQVLVTGPLAPITKDSACVIRRIVILNPKSAKILIDSSAAVPAISVNAVGRSGSRPTVNTHLTNNFSPGAISPQGNTASPAWSAAAAVALTVSVRDPTISNWNFGFIQFQKIKQATAHFVGRDRVDGRFEIDAGIPPVLPRNVGRDCADRLDLNRPWTRDGTAGSLSFNSATGLATGVTGDHPMMMLAATDRNNTTGYDNFLLDLIDEREFVTVFSARDPLGIYTHLAHFVWSVRWHFTFGWKPGGIPIAVKHPSTSFTMGIVVQGAPPQPELQGFLPDPVKAQRVGSPESTGAVQTAMLFGRPPNRTEFEERGAVPPDFNP